MHEPFQMRDGALCCDGLPLADIAARFGTPLYVYSAASVRDRFRALRHALAPAGVEVFYAVKASSNLSLLALLAGEGAGMEVVSGGELYRARAIGVPDARIVFDGVGKTESELRYALEGDLRFFAVESEPELARLARLARECGRRARVSLRVNPDIDPRTHRHISTGKRENKFGFDLVRIRAAYDDAAAADSLEVVGLHMHIGSQILSEAPHAEALAKVLPLVRDLARRFPSFRYLDLGGGLGIRYRPEEQPLDAARFAAAVLPLLQGLELQAMVEPGRYLVGDGAVLLARVEYVKEGPDKTFIVTDAAMNDLIRPVLYGAYHHIVPVAPRSGASRPVDIVGAICETGDFFAQDRELAPVQAGDLLAVQGAGAYGFAMASTYNSRPRAAEVLVDPAGGGARLIRRRETYADLVAGELPYVTGTERSGEGRD